MSEEYEKLKEYWNGKLGKYGEGADIIREHGKELNSYAIASIDDIIEQLNNNNFRLESYGKTSWNKFLDIAHLKEYLKPGYVTDALSITTHQPAFGMGEYLFVSCFKNLGFSKESGDLVDFKTKQKIEFKGNRATFDGENKGKIKYKQMNVIYSISSLFDEVENSDSFDENFCKIIDAKLKKQPDLIDKVIEICQNIEPQSHTLTKMFSQLYKEKEDLLYVVAAMHCYTYLKMQEANWLIITNKSGFAIFEAPQDAEDAWNIVKQLTVGPWYKNNKSVEIKL